MSRYAPPPERFGAGSMGIAFLVHGFLIAALTWGTSWRSESTITTASAELWAAIPVEAAPPLIVQAPLPTKPTPETPTAKAPEIVVEKIKPTLKKTKKESKQDIVKLKEAEVEAERVREQMRQDQIKRMAGLAGAAGSASSIGTAKQSAAPSASYAGKVEAAIRPNIVFADADSLQGNPATEVDIRIAPDGTIVGAPKLMKSSGIKTWDAAVLRAIERTETLPKDTDGRVPSSMTLVLRPKR